MYLKVKSTIKQNYLFSGISDKTEYAPKSQPTSGGAVTAVLASCVRVPESGVCIHISGED